MDIGHTCYRFYIHSYFIWPFPVYYNNLLPNELNDYCTYRAIMECYTTWYIWELLTFSKFKQLEFMAYDPLLVDGIL